LNLAVLQRLDREILQILETAGHVAIYSFLQETNAWEKKEVEGSLFVVERRTDPQFQFWVMNRLNTNNVVEDITKGFQMQVSEPYLLYRNKFGEINGIWFYNPSEGENIVSIIQKLEKSSNRIAVTNSAEQLHQLFSPSLLRQRTSQTSLMTKDQLRTVLTTLVKDEQFIEIVFREYIKFQGSFETQ